MHPVKDIQGIKTNILKDKKIVLGVTGSIAAVETIKLAREIIRHGAEVIPVMSQSATKIIHPDSLWFATGNKPIVELTGATEHVSYCGRVKDPVNMLLICPCTANTISKIAYGIDDTTVTTFATTAIGSKIPVLIVPAMHLSMYNHKIIHENISKLKKIGLNFINPDIVKNKAKIPSIENIVANIIRITGNNKLSGKKILIIGGPTAEKVDDIRVITNISSGKTAVNLAKQSFFMDGDVTIWYGYGSEKVPDYIKKVDFRAITDLEKLINKTDLNKFEIIVVCAAISDYIPKRHKGKIKSGEDKLIIELKPAKKILQLIRKKTSKTILIGFKLEDKKEKLNRESINLLKKYNLDFVVGNTVAGFSGDENQIKIFDKSGNSVSKKGKKEELAKFILNKIIIDSE